MFVFLSLITLLMFLEKSGPFFLQPLDLAGSIRAQNIEHKLVETCVNSKKKEEKFLLASSSKDRSIAKIIIQELRRQMNIYLPERYQFI